MHYVTEKNLGNGPADMLVGASEVYQTEQYLFSSVTELNSHTEQEESEPQD
jgi:hypothetical protein